MAGRISNSTHAKNFLTLPSTTLNSGEVFLFILPAVGHIDRVSTWRAPLVTLHSILPSQSLGSWTLDAQEQSKSKFKWSSIPRKTLHRRAWQYPERSSLTYSDYPDHDLAIFICVVLIFQRSQNVVNLTVFRFQFKSCKRCILPSADPHQTLPTTQLLIHR